MNENTLHPPEIAVIYREGPFRWNKKHAGKLTWTSNDRIKLVIFDKKKNETELFDTSLEDIRKVGGVLSYLTFYLKGQPRFRLDVWYGVHKRLSTTTDMLLNEIQGYNKSSVDHWVSALGTKGVKLRYLNGRNFTIFSFALTAVIIALTVGLILLVEHFN